MEQEKSEPISKPKDEPSQPEKPVAPIAPPLAQMPPEVMHKAVEDLKNKVLARNLHEKMDLSTLQSVAAVISQHGFDHFEASKDTRQPMENRRAHRFVALNCEDLARKTLRLSGQTSEVVEKMLAGIALAALNFKQERDRKKNGISPLQNSTGP